VTLLLFSVNIITRPFLGAALSVVCLSVRHVPPIFSK